MPLFELLDQVELVQVSVGLLNRLQLSIIIVVTIVFELAVVCFSQL